MILKELLKKLKAFDCAALNESEVSHYFVADLGSGYQEIVENVMYDPKNNRIVLNAKTQNRAFGTIKRWLNMKKERKNNYGRH